MAAAQPDVVGHVYVNDNTAGMNTVAGLARHADGTLSLLPGSPYAIGGAGTGSVTGSQGAIQLSSDGRYLLAVDAGSNQISVAGIQPDGSLQPVEGTPVASGGATPVSIAVYGNLVYVANGGAGDSNYTGFRLNDGGQLQPIDDSTFPLPDDAVPGDLVFNRDGTRLIGARVGPDAGPSYIDSFVVGADGRLTAAPGSPYPSQGVGPLGSEFRPTSASQLYVTIAHDGPGNGSVSALNVGADGTLTPISAEPTRNDQSGTCWIEISHDGRFLYAVNTGTPSISSYAIAADGTLTFMSNTSFKSAEGLRPFDARLDLSGKYLYVVGAGSAMVSVFAVDGGSLTEMANSPMPLPDGATPFGIVVN
jgi:6-phosphogluconolactonase (cycloisomerase 2 family)